ncbi:hypothetical protein DUNSADRAFT_4021 [Dunaliella salina]|uniref:Uncharacterized protein n=1 Tax=Dunaliella salina TaxID=3046 RepID=A0ABQ7FV08_DUNSA|nr:hypothetical protein DUNSADRAFT_4021 [Dunaliella salina]|eukprot:KAF5826236.1 hypothetical protein DUNSADRAFT_4021 [Dunaliella salina]
MACTAHRGAPPSTSWTQATGTSCMPSRAWVMCAQLMRLAALCCRPALMRSVLACPR